jgi:hypothetical protein
MQPPDLMNRAAAASRNAPEALIRHGMAARRAARDAVFPINGGYFKK